MPNPQARRRVALVTILISWLALALAGGARADTAVAPHSSVPIRTPDGVALAADVFVPPVAGRFPAVLVMTPYGRATRLSRQALYALVADRMAVVLVDMRGTGASQGSVQVVFSREERTDIGTVVRWITRQPWSNGQVIPTGTSYDGNLSALALTLTGRAIVAAIPRFIDFDTYRDLALPGGIRNEMLLRAWGALTAQLNHGLPCLLRAAACKGLSWLEPLDGDTGYRLLRAALLEHQSDWNAYGDTMGYAFEDDVTPSGRRLNGGFLSSEADALRTSRVPIQLWGSWFDAGTADSALHWYGLARSTPMELYIGAWSHGGGTRVDPLISDHAEDETGAPSLGGAILGFIERATHRSQVMPRVIHYYTAGAGVWRTTATWPPDNIASRRWYLSGERALSTLGSGGGPDSYTVDLAATTGDTNRWTTQLGGGPVDYGDRGAADRKLLTYTSAPLRGDIEITGAPVATLRLSTSAPDGAIFVYLEAVEPAGRVIYLSEGELRLALRGGGATNHPPGAWPSFLREDARYLEPGHQLEIAVPLHGVSVRLTRGMRLRLALAGADAGTFARYPAAGDPVLTIQHSASAPSFVDIPEAPWRASPPPEPR